MIERTMNRRTLGKIAAGTAAATAAKHTRVFAQDASPAAGSDMSGSVLFWVYPAFGAGEQAENEEAWAKVVTAFNELYPNVEVSVEVLPWAQRNEKLITALAANSGPDVGYLNDDFIPQHAFDGNLLEVDALTDDTFDAFKASMSFEDAVYAYPFLGSVTTVVANTKAYADAGLEVPATWDDVLASGPALKEQGLYATSYNGSIEMTLNMTYFPLLWQAGGSVLTEDASAPAFNSDAGVAALEFIKELYDQGFVDEGEMVVAPEAGAGQLQQGKVAMTYCGQKMDVASMGAVVGEENIGVFAPLTSEQQIGYGTGAGLSVFANAENPEAAMAWAAFASSDDMLRELLPLGGFMPPRESLSDMYEPESLEGQFQQYQPLMRGGIRHPQARPIIAAMAPYIQAAIIGDMEIADALATASDEVQALLDS